MVLTWKQLTYLRVSHSGGFE